jgi:PAS domain S-box-containing protein
MKSTGAPMTMEQQLREINEALLISSVRQHELTEQAQKAEAALRESEERYRTLFDLGPVAIYSCLASGVIDHFNRRAEELWGRAPAQGDSLERFCGSLKLFRLDGTLMPHEQCPMAEVLSGKIAEVNDAEVLIERPDGSRVAVIINIRPLRNQRGEVTGAINSFYDITERYRAEAAVRDSQTRFEAVFEASPVGMYLVDAELRIRLVSRTARPMFGDIGELIGRNFVEVIHILWPPECADEIVARFRHTLETGQPHIAFEFSEVRYDRRVRECYDWQIHRINLPNGQYGVVCYFIDVSKRMQLSDDLRQYAANMFDADRRKNEFLAMLAHELRNPLAPISNALQIMRLAEDPQSVHAATEMMEHQVGEMVRLLDDLLDVNRISRGTIELRRGRVELASVVRHAVEASRPAMESAEQALTITLPPQPIYLNVDPTRLAQVVGNLLNNANKYTDKGGRIGLTVEREGEQAVIRVGDNGIGIAADQLARIFDMFVQVDASLARSVGGLGIGLALVKNLVEMHGGTVEVHSAGVGQGSEFVVRLPVIETIEPAQPPLPEPTVSAPTTSTPSYRILVVDDNRLSADSMAKLLELTGHEAHTAYDGLEAVEAAAAFRPGVILLDIGLPKLNGYEAALKIREQPWGKNIVMVALTGWGQDEDRQKSNAAGLNGHMVKPVELTALMKLLAELQPTAGVTADP